MYKFAAAAIAALSISFSGAGAAQTVNFDGTVTATCSLAGATNGAITLNSDLKSWSTTTPASITATNTAQSVLTVTRSGAWSASPKNTPTTTFGHQASVTGANTLSDSQFSASNNAKTGKLANSGTNQVSMSVSASAATPYPPGTYQTQVTVTCVPN